VVRAYWHSSLEYHGGGIKQDDLRPYEQNIKTIIRHHKVHIKQRVCHKTTCHMLAKPAKQPGKLVPQSAFYGDERRAWKTEEAGRFIRAPSIQRGNNTFKQCPFQ
jgi:hypothetical protein